MAGVFALLMSPMAAFGVGALTADTSITVGGLVDGDSASYYQIIQQNASTKAWELTTAVDADGAGAGRIVVPAGIGHKKTS